MIKIDKKVRKFLLDIKELIRKPVMSILPGQLSFFLLLSIIPLMLIIGVIASISSISTNEIIDVIKTNLPFDISELIIPILDGSGVSYNVIILIISSFLLASKGTKSITTVASIIYETKEEKTIKKYIKSFVLAINLILLIMFLLVVPVLSSRIIIFLSKIKMISFAVEPLLNMINILKWPITILIIFINIKIIYVYSPNKEIPMKSVNSGTVFTTILWVLTTWVYSFYINNFSSYNIFYGGASNLIILMLWIYFMSYIFVLGMSINASYLKNYN